MLNSRYVAILLIAALSVCVGAHDVVAAEPVGSEGSGPTLETFVESDVLYGTRSSEGVLVVDDEVALGHLLAILVGMDRFDRESWERGVGFVSQESLFDFIRDEEIRFEEKHYQGVDEDLSIKELEKLGYVVNVKEDKDGGEVMKYVTIVKDG